MNGSRRRSSAGLGELLRFTVPGMGTEIIILTEIQSSEMMHPSMLSDESEQRRLQYNGQANDAAHRFCREQRKSIGC